MNRIANRTASRVANRIVVLAVAVAAAGPTGAQSLFSPAPLTGPDWATTGTVQLVVQQVAPAATVPAPQPAAPAPAQPAVQASAPAAVQAAAQAPAPTPAPAAPLAALSEPSEPAGPALRSEVTVVGEIVRIGDLVENAGAVADVAIFRAPDLGQVGSVPAARVIEAVRRHHILWLNTRGLDEVRVARASRLVANKEIEARVIRALAAQTDLGDVKNLSATLDAEVRTLHVEPNAELGIGRASYDARSRRFDVSFDVPTSATRKGALRVTGTLVETVEAVVPVRAINQGEVIKASDLMVERRPKTDVVAVEDVLGLAAKRQLRPGQVIRAGDVMKPELVARNEAVTISFEAPGMVLTVRGKALEPGAMGDVVNVLNVQSQRTVQATVSGPGRVTVTAKSPRLAANVETSGPQQ